ncbi:hypothetical protein B0H11DRAFT_2023129 [Mycena galericulata]|nr:hypothetical protein B0H11DRAFT_2023129 [Mycena galericulata]
MWVLLYSQYVLLKNCFARGIHVRALPVLRPFHVVQVCPSLPLPLPACVLTYLYPTQYNSPARVPRRLLVSASTDRRRRSYGAAMYP